MYKTIVGVVILHFIVTVLHGIAHTKAEVPLSLAESIFVFTVVIAGPLIGLVVMPFSKRMGAVLIALTMAGALVFGVVNHFVLSSRDHIAHVVGRWQLLFAGTAILVALTEALGSVLAFNTLRGRRSR